MSPDQGPDTKRDKDLDKKSPEDLDALGKKLSKARETEDSRRLWKSNATKRPNSALGLAFRVAVELVSAVAVGCAIGWGMDYLLDTKPWLMVVFIVLGFAAGVMNVYRMAAGFGSNMGYEKDNEAHAAKSADNAPDEEGKD